ncbi:hypothetical protein N7493_001586 [Penicillium malachiteum]|uniref:Uncharacterized protein n=1 Tax=Penicillium malachiteum TaxID=1324776 RepID=A0AAD6HUP4_9EURO|nr:hypothetical protein N7493_001586 [Penicillium malachiteum]
MAANSSASAMVACSKTLTATTFNVLSNSLTPPNIETAALLSLADIESQIMQVESQIMVAQDQIMRLQAEAASSPTPGE